MSQSLTHKKIAKRYVGSLFSGLTTKAESTAVEKNMAELGAMIAGSAELQNFITSPLYSKQVQEKTIETLASKAKFSQSMINFLKTLVENRRLNILPTIIDETVRFVDEQSGTIIVKIATARDLSAADQKKIQAQIKSAIDRDVSMDVYVDQSLIGGVVLQIQSTLIDGSIKTKLDKLERQLTKGLAA